MRATVPEVRAGTRAADGDRRRGPRMHATLDNLTDGFIALDRDWRVTYLNPAAQAAVGMTAEQLLGRTLWEAFPEAGGTLFEDNYREAMERRIERRFDAPYPPLGMWFRISAFPLDDGIALSFSDITAARRASDRLLQLDEELEQRVRERTGQLKQANDELADFTLAVAHELREPLAGIAGFSRAAQERLAGREDMKIRHFLTRIRAGVTRMEGLMDALLQLAHIGRAALEPRRVDLTALVNCTVEILRAAEPGRDARVEVQQGMVAEGDPRLLRILVENLVGSVWRASATRALTVICVGRRADGAFFVRDVGNEPDLVPPPDLANPYARLGVDGEGIALASARRVVERHGGRIWTEGGDEGRVEYVFRLSRKG